MSPKKEDRVKGNAIQIVCYSRTGLGIYALLSEKRRYMYFPTITDIAAVICSISGSRLCRRVYFPQFTDLLRKRGRKTFFPIASSFLTVRKLYMKSRVET